MLTFCFVFVKFCFGCFLKQDANKRRKEECKEKVSSQDARAMINQIIKLKNLTVHHFESAFQVSKCWSVCLCGCLGCFDVETPESFYVDAGHSFGSCFNFYVNKIHSVEREKKTNKTFNICAQKARARCALHKSLLILLLLCRLKRLINDRKCFSSQHRQERLQFVFLSVRHEMTMMMKKRKSKEKICRWSSIATSAINCLQDDRHFIFSLTFGQKESFLFGEKRFFSFWYFSKHFLTVFPYFHQIPPFSLLLKQVFVFLIIWLSNQMLL